MEVIAPSACAGTSSLVFGACFRDPRSVGGLAAPLDPLESGQSESESESTEARASRTEDSAAAPAHPMTEASSAAVELSAAPSGSVPPSPAKTSRRQSQPRAGPSADPAPSPRPTTRSSAQPKKKSSKGRSGKPSKGKPSESVPSRSTKQTAATAPAVSKPKSEKERLLPDRHNSVCLVCEDPDDLMPCSGGCSRLFHSDCFELYDAKIRGLPRCPRPKANTGGAPAQLTPAAPAAAGSGSSSEPCSSPSEAEAAARALLKREAQDSDDDMPAQSRSNGAQPQYGASSASATDPSSSAPTASAAAEEEVETVLCPDCQLKEAECLLCSRRGPVLSLPDAYRDSQLRSAAARGDPSAAPDACEPLTLCHDKRCGRAYHLSCVEAHPLTSRAVKRPKSAKRSSSVKADKSPLSASVRPFLCPSHTCRTCKERSGCLVTCLLCPTAYHHPDCVAPSALRLVYKTILCGKHPDRQRLHGPERGGGSDSDDDSDSDSENRSESPPLAHGPAPHTASSAASSADPAPPPALGSGAEGEGLGALSSVGPSEPSPPSAASSSSSGPIAARSSSSPGWPAKWMAAGPFCLFPRGSTLENVDDIVWTPAATARPFRIPLPLLQQGREWEDSAPPPYQRVVANQWERRPPGLLKDDVLTCVCSPEDGCSADKCINRAMLVECLKRHCPAGDKCQNQRLQRRRYCKSKVARVQGKGFGLFAKEDVPPDTLVAEYCGEVIDGEEAERRLEAMQRDEAPHFYIFKVSNSFVIDAGPMGNIARFINHSCNPNCVTQKWTVGSQLRVGIFTKDRVAKGEEFSYDYNFATEATGVKQRCLCGADNCSGFLGDRPKRKEAEPSKAKRKAPKGSDSTPSKRSKGKAGDTKAKSPGPSKLKSPAAAKAKAKTPSKAKSPSKSPASRSRASTPPKSGKLAASPGTRSRPSPSVRSTRSSPAPHRSPRPPPRDRTGSPSPSAGSKRPRSAEALKWPEPKASKSTAKSASAPASTGSKGSKRGRSPAPSEAKSSTAQDQDGSMPAADPPIASASASAAPLEGPAPLDPSPAADASCPSQPAPAVMAAPEKRIRRIPKKVPALAPAPVDPTATQADTAPPSGPAAGLAPDPQVASSSSQ